MNLPTVGILLFPDVEVLDFAGPFEVFSVATRDDGSPAFAVHTVSADGAPLRTIGGLQVLPGAAFDAHPPLDVLVVPGGNGRRTAMHHAPTLDWVRRHGATARQVLSVCTGAFILGHAGLLQGCAATTHHGCYDEFAAAFPEVPLHRDTRYVDNGRIVTAAGISAGIEAALFVVARLAGHPAATRTATEMVWPYGW